MIDDFAADGQLAKAIPGFKPREPQRQMAVAVSEAIEASRPLVVEAGTGTGKTYAYLAPALRAKKKVIISTGSKALQDQLYSRDLPTVAKALKFTGKLALLKGRSNYLCLERLEQQALAGGDLPVQTLSDVILLRSWSNQTQDGDISTCASVAEDSQAWPLVTSTNDNCLGSDCPLYKDCFVVKARKKAMDADVVVVNHHLFLADMVVKESGFAELIPEAEVMMLDAAFERATLYRGRLKRLKEINLPGYSYWYECTSRHFTLALTPLTVAEKFKEVMAQKSGSWIFTSATLSVNDDLHHFTARLGIDEAQTLLLPSPFDYQHQALLCVPRNLPLPNQPGAARHLAAMLKPLIEANDGRCFMLCTSHAMMRDLAEQFRATMTLPVLLQGETSKGQLLQQFVSAGNALLVATSSFWEGVDVRGDALSLVIIDKLPFTSPDDPLLKARMEDCRLRGGDPFDEVQLPDAVITLKQGVGRLIRDIDDRGVLVICDNRLVMRPYGAVFLASLPPAPRTRDIRRAVRFLAVPPAR
ncbi:MAG: ATP-dependent DNA helicase [Klebsiella pneumoniae]|nr:ATP-dependent DNA helicase [Klebsiella pneumoniae]